MDNIITRMIEDVSIEERSGGMYISGYGTVFDVVYEYAPGKFERIKKAALSNADMSQCECRYNHSSDFVLGDVPTNTLTLKQDAKGLHYQTRFDADDPDHMKVRSKLQKGLVKGSSIGFLPTKIVVTKEDGKLIENVESISYVRDLGPVNSPASPSAGVTCEARASAYSEFEKKQHMIAETQKRFDSLV